MYSDKYKFIFIHIDKNAGSTVTHFLQDYINQEVKLTDGKGYFEHVNNLDEEDKKHLENIEFDGKQIEIENKHYKARDYERIYPEKYKNYTKFAIVRNPWDRALSGFMFLSGFWVYANEPEKVRNSIEFEKFLKDEEFLHAIEKKMKKIVFGDQVSFLKNSKNEIDPSIILLKYEKLNESINKLCKFLHIDTSNKQLPSINKTRVRHYSHFYTPTTKKLVEQKFSEDIYSFGYKFEKE